MEDDNQIAGGSAAKAVSKKVDVSAAPDPEPDEAKKGKNSDFELLAVMAKQKSAVGEEPARGRRLGTLARHFGARGEVDAPQRRGRGVGRPQYQAY